MLHLEVALFCLKPRKNPFNWIGPKHQSLLWFCLASWCVIWFMSVTSFKGSMLLRFRDTYFCFCLQTGWPVTELRCHKVFCINFMPHFLWTCCLHTWHEAWVWKKTKFLTWNEFKKTSVEAIEYQKICSLRTTRQKFRTSFNQGNVNTLSPIITPSSVCHEETLCHF